MCSLLCVCTLDGLIAEHKFRVWVTILGRMSRHFHFTFSLYPQHLDVAVYFSREDEHPLSATSGLISFKDADRVTFLDSPISLKGLFSLALDGFAECFMAAQKSSQDMHRFLPKRSSSVAASNRQKAPSFQQPAKPGQSPAKPQPKSEPRFQQHPQQTVSQVPGTQPQSDVGR